MGLLDERCFVFPSQRGTFLSLFATRYLSLRIPWVLQAELGDLDRFARLDQVVAYAGMDLQVRQSGKWKGQPKLSKRGSGRLRRMVYLAALRSIRLPTSPFGIYYHRLVDRGMKKGMAVVAVMRKLLIVAAHLIQTQEDYDAGKVGRAVVS